MKPKTIVTVAILLFVAVIIVYLVVKETGGKRAQNATQSETTSPQTGQEHGAPPPASSENKTTVSKVVAYYFHGNMRCMTCRTIESYAKETIESEFVDALKDGRLEWRVVNVEAHGNGHFVQDFQLTTRSVVLERLADGKRQDWKNLDRVWQLVRSDKAGFMKYIQDETGAYLEAASK